LGKQEVSYNSLFFYGSTIHGFYSSKDTFWFIRFLGEEGYKHEKPTLIFTEFQGNLVLLKNLVHHSCIKQIDIQFHFVKEHIFVVGVFNLIVLVLN